MKRNFYLALIAFVSIVVLLPAVPARAGMGQWTTNGPFGASINAFAVSPNFVADHTIFAGGAGGALGKIYKSTDGGANWATSLFAQTDVDSILCLAISPTYATDQTVFAGITYNLFGGIYKTTNGGTTWTPINIGNYISVGVLALSPNFSTDNTIFAGTLSGVYKSTNGGGSWSLMTTGMSGSKNMASFAISPNFASDKTVFAGADNGEVYKTINGGTGWSLVNSIPMPVTSYQTANSLASHRALRPITHSSSADWMGFSRR